MTRLIDADELAEIINWTFAKPPFSRKTVQKMIDMARTIDAVPVIRCNDCIHNVANRKTDPLDTADYSGIDIVCDYFMTDGQEPDDYCSKAEPKETEQ